MTLTFTVTCCSQEVKNTRQCQSKDDFFQLCLVTFCDRHVEPAVDAQPIAINFFPKQLLKGVQISHRFFDVRVTLKKLTNVA